NERSHRLPSFCRRLFQRLPERLFERNRRAVPSDGEGALERLQIQPLQTKGICDGRRELAPVRNVTGPSLLLRRSLALQRIEPLILQTALGLGALVHMLGLAEGRAVSLGLLLPGRTCLLLAEAAEIDDFGAHPALNPTGRSSSPDGRWR